MRTCAPNASSPSFLHVTTTSTSAPVPTTYSEMRLRVRGKSERQTCISTEKCVILCEARHRMNGLPFGLESEIWNAHVVVSAVLLYFTLKRRGNIAEASTDLRARGTWSSLQLVKESNSSPTTSSICLEARATLAVCEVGMYWSRIGAGSAGSGSGSINV